MCCYLRAVGRHSEWTILAKSRLSLPGQASCAEPPHPLPCPQGPCTSLLSPGAVVAGRDQPARFCGSQDWDLPNFCHMCFDSFVIRQLNKNSSARVHRLALSCESWPTLGPPLASRWLLGEQLWALMAQPWAWVGMWSVWDRHCIAMA